MRFKRKSKFETPPPEGQESTVIETVFTFEHHSPAGKDLKPQDERLANKDLKTKKSIRDMLKRLFKFG